MATLVDARPFVSWIVDEYEPALRIGEAAGHYARGPGQGKVELYGVADMACVLYTIRRLRPDAGGRAEWAEAFAAFQDPLGGKYAERGDRTHVDLHSTAFALAAMELLDLEPIHRLRFADPYRKPDAIGEFLDGLDWSGLVYLDSHRGAGLGSVFALAPGLGTAAWFDRYFGLLERRLDASTGMFGVGKPAVGDTDQIGGTFHYAFLYEWANRRLAHPEARIDTILGLQRKDALWDPDNPLWLTLDAVYLLSRASRRTGHRADEVRRAVERVMRRIDKLVLADEQRPAHFVDAALGAHNLTAAVSLLAETQALLGADRVVTGQPLRLVLDRRPFI